MKDKVAKGLCIGIIVLGVLVLADNIIGGIQCAELGGHYVKTWLSGYECFGVGK